MEQPAPTMTILRWSSVIVKEDFLMRSLTVICSHVAPLSVSSISNA